MNFSSFSIIKRKLSFNPYSNLAKEIPEYVARIMKSFVSLLMTLELLCDNKGLSAVCEQKFRTISTRQYLYGHCKEEISGKFVVI